MEVRRQALEEERRRREVLEQLLQEETSRRQMLIEREVKLRDKQRAQVRDVHVDGIDSWVQSEFYSHMTNGSGKIDRMYLQVGGTM